MSDRIDVNEKAVFKFGLGDKVKHTQIDSIGGVVTGLHMCSDRSTQIEITYVDNNGVTCTGWHNAVVLEAA